MFDYSSTGAATGHTPAHAPQDMHSSLLITYLSEPLEIHDTGHSLSQAPQDMQLSLITYAIFIHLLYTYDCITILNINQDKFFTPGA